MHSSGPQVNAKVTVIAVPPANAPLAGTTSADHDRGVPSQDEILDGVRLMPTPGHTPGHQSVLVEAGDQRVIPAAQCAFRADELRTGTPGTTNLHNESWRGAARESLARIRSLAPIVAHLSHDTTAVTLA
jgi:glyoxylase-like metal-dependent hydrolase (beta-lactamase superfamily II)